MKNLFVVAVTSIVLASCSSEVKEVAEVVQPIETPEEVVVIADSQLELEVEGMVCQMGCAAAIKGELLKTNAVAECDIDFVEERSSNPVKIKYDSQQIDEEKMIALIEEINEGQFTVK